MSPPSFGDDLFIQLLNVLKNLILYKTTPSHELIFIIFSFFAQLRSIDPLLRKMMKSSSHEIIIHNTGTFYMRYYIQMVP